MYHRSKRGVGGWTRLILQPDRLFSAPAPGDPLLQLVACIASRASSVLWRSVTLRLKDIVVGFR